MDASKPVKVPACHSLWSQVLLSGIHNFLSRLIVSVLLQSFSTSECAKMPGRLAHTLCLYWRSLSKDCMENYKELSMQFLTWAKLFGNPYFLSEFAVL